MKKLLYIEWNSVSNSSYKKAFSKIGLLYDILNIGKINEARHNFDLIVNACCKKLNENRYVFAFSINFIAGVAEACHRFEIPYIFWSYDSPAGLGGHNSQYVDYETTYGFLFDSKEVGELRTVELKKNVFYMPLAVDFDTFDLALKKNNTIDFSSQVSFVGSLYESRLGKSLLLLPDYPKAFINSLIDVSASSQDFDYLEGIVNEDFITWLDYDTFIKDFLGEKDYFYGIKSEEAAVLKQLIRQSATNKNRLMLVSLLSKHFEFKLYSYSSHEILSNSIECGSVDYETEMPLVFANSKINLNTTLKNIQNGIPLRCLDIMGCGGTLLTNHQKDFDEHFTDHENLLFYDSPEEALDKCKYYLEHDNQRQQIARLGYETVRKYYTYEEQLKKILNLTALDYLLK